MAENRVRYICPICDGELGASRHFCWNCKQFISAPWRFTGGHLPNESHDGCHPSQTFMKPRINSVPTYQHGGKNLAGKNNTSKQYTYNRPGQSSASAGRGGSYQNQQTYQDTRSYGGSRTRTSRKVNKKKVSLFFVFLFIYYLFRTFIGYFWG